MSPHPHAPPGVDLPPTVQTVAQLFGISEAGAKNWAAAGELGPPVGTVPGAGRSPRIYDWTAVLNHGLRSGRLNRDWDRLDPDGQIEGAAGSVATRSRWRITTVPKEPTVDLGGRRHYFLAHVPELLGVTASTVNQWRTVRQDTVRFPDPDMKIAGKPVWFEETLTAWGRETGRLDENGRPVRLT